MYVSIDWIRDFVNLPEKIDNELAQRFTLATCEVEEVKKTNEHLAKVLVVEIISTKPHPDADKLQLVTIETGNGTKEIVCGAANARAGIKVPFAPVGTTLPDGLTLEARKVRGILSEGMLCGEIELGIGDDDEGLKEFPQEAPVGTPLSEYLQIPTDIIIDIDNKSITNRPDLWAQYGMAREFAAVFQKELKNPFDTAWEKKLEDSIKTGKSPVTHTVDPQSACKGYFGLAMKNITVGTSPAWIQRRLIACGLRPINSLVDISNYVLLELGIPNHIFDMKKIRGQQISVKLAGEEIKFTTLDEQEREIAPSDTLIFDADGPVAIAGVMGGLDSSVTEETTEIFIECANFTDAKIRKTATRLGLRTDSSLRYEKSLDTHLLKRTALRLMELIIQTSPKAEAIGELHYEGESLTEPLLSIEIAPEMICNVLGKKVPIDEIIRILTSLEYRVEKKEEILVVTVPTWRATKDVEVDADIIEEIGRIIGYDNISPEAPKAEITTTSLSPEKQLQRKIADFLVMNESAFEIMTSPMVGKKLLTQCEWNTTNEELQLANSLSKESDRMRPSLIPSVLDAVARNSRNFNSFTLFEQGRSYLPDSKDFSVEDNWIIISWFDKKESSILKAINSAERLFNYLNLPGKVVERPSSAIFPENWIGLHPHENLSLDLFGKELGAIISIHPLLSSKLKIKGKTTLLALNISSFEKRVIKPKANYSPLPKFPGSNFDCTIVVNSDVDAAKAMEPIKKLKIKEIKSIKITGIYHLNDDEKTITLRTYFLNEKQTLEGKFLEEGKNKIIAALETAGFPLKK